MTSAPETTDHIAVDELLPKRPTRGGFAARALWEVRKQTIMMPRIFAPTTGSCEDEDFAPAPGRTLRCTVTYRGVEVPWKVTVLSEIEWDAPWYHSGEEHLQFRATPLRALLTEEAVHAAVLASFPREQRRCTEIPAVTLVDVGASTGFRCQYRYKGLTDDLYHWQGLDVRTAADGTLDLHAEG
ncbi:hypothetical protein [Actinocorallia populi]|uniref:hypothetical protein n=1 Tax=Actinocorallia populi TaxID=2079200 RepID=UPI000D08D921|nr:hypothetical protein [Actinocorallia populi]